MKQPKSKLPFRLTTYEWTNLRAKGKHDGAIIPADYERSKENYVYSCAAFNSLSQEDAEYIVYTANLFPAVVEQLQNMVDCMTGILPDDNPDLVRAKTFLATL